MVERDALPQTYEPLKGVPQGRHTHGLLARGREVLEQLFPHFTEGMVADGAVSGGILDELLWFHHGVYLYNAPSKLVGLAVSRPMLEGGVGRRLPPAPTARWPGLCTVWEALFVPALSIV